MQYDGSIRIDTRIESKGFNEGVKKVSRALGDIMKNIVATVARVAITAAAIGAALAGAIGVALAMVIKFGRKLTETLYKNLSTTSAMRDKVVQLKGAFDTLRGTILAMGATLLNALAPVLMKIIDWLVKAINWLSMFIAALTGQKTVMQYVSGAVGEAANSTGKLAKETKKAEKAAKGALAAFDEINVLQQDTAGLAEDEPIIPIGAFDGGSIIMREVAVPENWLQEQKERVVGWIKDTMAGAASSWNESVVPAARGWLEKTAEAVSNFADKFGEWFKAAWERIKNYFAIRWSVFIDSFVAAGEVIRNIWISVGTLAVAAWERISAIWGRAKDWFITNVIIPINNSFRSGWENIKSWAAGAWNYIKTVWISARAFFQNSVISPIQRAFVTAWGAIRSSFEKSFTGLAKILANVVNGIISVLNGMIRSIVSGINSLIRSLNSFRINIPATWLTPAVSFGMSIQTLPVPQIPKLASGAVIPPNSEFAAILGDQRSGTNIETPVSLMRQTFEDVLRGIEVEGNFTFNFDGTLGALVRDMKPYIDKENVRIGTSLATRSKV